MNGDFALFYIKDDQFYPVGLTEEQNLLIQNFMNSLFRTTGEKRLQIFDQPVGPVVNLSTKKPNSSANGSSQ